jgi:hypothetical protein
MNPRPTTRSSTGSCGTGSRDRGALEQRRLQAARLFAKDMRPAQVARELGVSRQAATVWYHAWQEEAEGLWSNLKSQELANRCEAHVQIVAIAARQGSQPRVFAAQPAPRLPPPHRTPALIASFTTAVVRLGYVRRHDDLCCASDGRRP